MIEQPKKFIADTLRTVYPPMQPLLKADWSGLAFDRNFYTDIGMIHTLSAIKILTNLRYLKMLLQVQGYFGWSTTEQRLAFGIRNPIVDL